MKTAIVILNWNGRSLLERFLESVVTHSAHLATIYLADNASTDSSVAYCKEHFPEDVKIIQNKENGGYAKGYNDALRHVDADLYVLLNSDVKVEKGWLEPMVSVFVTSASIAVAQPKIKDLKRPTLFEYAGAAGGYIDALGYPYCRGRIFDHCEEDTGQYNDTVDVQWASGACLFIRAKLYWDANGLDEDFFAHQEEIDLCWRIKNKGYRIVAVGDSEVFHLGGATLSSANPQKTFYNFRNTLFAVVKNSTGVPYLLLVLIRLILDGIAGFKFLLEGKPKHVLAIIKAHVSFYRHFPNLLKKRKALKQSHQYYQVWSIVFKYFIKNKKTYRDLL
ncbi:glycosyltransferase family 2 protein [uncultured Dokdonia sp.]|uniref:glycosyltransferase family 2 protein n=1 Tax=uncultured Dokdonia sp. TaxID=575653 RepID=UPI00260C4212|nr:glycosyltransferase family 2 protein [uncultured Dokdonia sp.]